MITITHTLAGAAIGYAVRDVSYAPAIAFGLGWASHYALDTIPHWEGLIKPDIYGLDLTKNVPRIVIIQATLDVLLAAAIIISVLIFNGELSAFWQSPIFWGALGGAFPDLVDNVPFWAAAVGRTPVLKSIRKFHGSVHIDAQIQKRMPKYVGLVTQLVVIGLALLVLAF
jgi:hypothetical protein